MSKNKINHIAVIMDGNRRWAKKNNLDFLKGYNIGANAIKEAVLGCLNNGIKYLTCYAFSVENWHRNILEVESLKTLLSLYLTNNAHEFIDNQIKFQVIGDYSKFGSKVSKKIDNLIYETKDFDKLTVSLALNYGSKHEIVRGINQLITQVKQGNFKENEVTLENFEEFLYTKGIPDPDFIIRTGGEKRLSNFLLWQASYSEFIFYDFMWPEFKAHHIDDAISEFSQRERRHGS